MQHRNIPYEYREWTAYNGQECSSYTCKYFNFYPYYLMSFPAKTEQEMQDKIDDVFDIPMSVLIDTEINYCLNFNKVDKVDIKMLDKVVNLTSALEKAIEQPYIAT